MKKILPYILIALIAVNLFAPFNIGIDKKNDLVVKKSTAEASYILVELVKDGRTESSIKFHFHVKRLSTTQNNGMIYIVTDEPVNFPQGLTEDDKRNFINAIYVGTYTSGFGLLFLPSSSNTTLITKGDIDIGNGNGTPLDQTFDVPEITGLTPNKVYYVSYAAYNGTKDDAYALVKNSTISTAEKGKVDAIEEVTSSANGGSYLPSCVWGLINVSVSGCVAQLLYTALFQPTSYLFGLAGKFFDYTFFYSVSDKSYKSEFVKQGWGLVRDFVNLFFIFVLLYIAFATILSLHGFKTKEMIINVVIIGLLINFSLFATQVIIDTSNILARVFYSSVNVKTETTDNADSNDQTTPKNKLGANGETQLSAQIVGKVNPQTLIIKAADVGSTKAGSDQADVETNSKGISNGTFILVTLLATAVNIVGMFVFLTSGLIFIARVVGLWLAMILVPFAFFSYTVPAMRDIEMLGWKKWWPQTLKLAFLAPIFIFFLYLIIKFLNIKDFFSVQGTNGADLILSIIFPFAVIIILLNQAKKLAVKFSGDIGSAVTKAGMAAGGIALGGAALSAAFVGRNTVGAVAKFTQNNTARKSALGFKDTQAAWQKSKKQWWNPLAHIALAGTAIKGVGKAATAGTAQLLHNTPSFTGFNPDGTVRTVGDAMQAADRGFGEKVHSTQILDDKMQSEFGHQYGKEAKFKDLTETEQTVVKREVDKDEMAKNIYGKKFKDLEAPESKIIQDRYRAGDRPIADSSGKTDRVANMGTVNTAAGEKIRSDAIVDFSKINAPIGEFVQALRKGSMDVRNLSETKTKSKGFLPILGVGLAAAIATGVRAGLKKGMGVEYGTGQKDFLKDLGNTVTEALKAIKINVKVGADGESHSKEVKSVGH